MIALGVAYFLVASFSILCTRFDGGFAHIWIAAALLNAELMRTPTRRWWLPAITCGIASAAATGLTGLGPAVAVPLAFVNIGESLIGAGLLRRLGKHDDYLATMGNAGLFVVCAGVIAPLVSAMLAGLLAAGITALSYGQLVRNWFAGHALGMLVFAPPMTMFLRREFGEWVRSLTTARRIEGLALFAALAGVCVLAFWQERVPLLFMPMLPLIIITFRLERVGAAIGVMILVTIGSVATALGHGPVFLLPGTPTGHGLFLQVYFAVSVLTVLPAAVELRQRRDIFRRLRESEARYRLITENASDIVIELDARNIVRYVSPSVREITGFAPEELVGRGLRELIGGPDRRVIMAARRAVRRQPGACSTVEYRAPDALGTLKWYEAKIRGLMDEEGALVGSVSVVRDISDRKSVEMRLAHAATTDSLTGLGNRRAFDALLDRHIETCRAGAAGGCVAIFDIDFFKRVNDQFGHAVGDRVLEHFAATAIGVVRPHDYVARLGGEEFGIILNGVDIDQAERICDRLRTAVARAGLPTATGATLSVTVSAGITVINPTRSRDEVMRAADSALYVAKAAGRDRLAIAA